MKDSTKRRSAWIKYALAASIAGVLFLGYSYAQSTLRVDVNLVNIFLTVQDNSGNYITDLARDDFRVFEDGVEQKVDVFERQNDVKSEIGILLDNSGSMVDILPMMKTGALSFVQGFQRFDDLFVMSFGTDVRVIQDFRQSSRNLESELKLLQPFGTSVLYDAMIEAMAKIRKGDPVRKALIIFTDGNDNGSTSNFYDATLAAQRSGVLLYFIPIGAKVHIDRNTVESLASTSGGRVVYLAKTDPISPAMESIRTELAKQYYLGYYAPRKPGFHQLRVEVPARSLMIRAKTGYLGG